jgi:hypothetical protein
MWFTFYTSKPRGRFQTNAPQWRDFLRLLRGYRIRITREPLDLTTLRPMHEILSQQAEEAQ